MYATSANPKVSDKAQMRLFNSEELVEQAEKYLSSINSSLKTIEASGTLDAVADTTTIDDAPTADNFAVKRQPVLPPVSVLGPAVRPANTLPAVRPANTLPDTDASPLQIWEGRVLSVDSARRVMEVLLSAKLIPDHTGEIDLEWVSEQDADLVRPGAVFYLTLYKRWKRTTVENSQELRFRRMPSWTKGQLQQVQQDTRMLLSKVRAAPIAE